MVKEVQTTEVHEVPTQDGHSTTQVVESDVTPSTSILLQRAVYYIVGFVITLLLFRMALLLLAANQSNGFVDFVYTISGVFASPFYGIFSYTPVYGSSIFEISSVVAIFVYSLVGWGIVKLITIGSTHREV